MAFFNDLKKSPQNIIKNWITHAEIKGATTSNLKWILNDAKMIEDYILSKKNTKDGTKSVHFAILAKLIERLGNNELYKKYSKIATNYNKKVQAKQREQDVLPERARNWVPWEEVMVRREQLREESEEDPDNLKKHLSYLILSLYTYQPPIRGEYFNMEITKNKPPEDDKNYLWEHGNKYTIVLNHHKTKKKYGRKEIDLDSKTLINIIDESLEQFPRKYILSAIKKQWESKPLTLSNFRNSIELFPGNQVSIDLLRSFYITQFYNNLSTDEKGKTIIRTIADKERLASKMLHSVAEAEKSYNKPKEKGNDSDSDSDSESDNESESDSDSDSDDEVERKEKKEKKISKKEKKAPEIKEQKIPVRKPFDRKAWAKEYMPKYRAENREKFQKDNKNHYEKNKYNILRKKYLREYNSGNVGKPKPSTIQKYNFVYDEESKTWR